MEEKKKKHGKYSYINSYRADAEGKLVFVGKYYSYSDRILPRKQYFTRMLSLLSAGALISVLSGCISADGSTDSFWVIIPFIAEISSVVFALWKAVSLATAGEPIKDYIYSATVKQIPTGAIMFSGFSAIGFISETVYIIVHAGTDTFAKALVYTALKLLNITLGYIVYKVSKNDKYTEQ